MKFIFNLIKWLMLFAGIVIFVDAQMKISAMEESRNTGMAEVIIDPTTHGYFTIYDNCDKSEIINFILEEPTFFHLFQEEKIKLYLRKGDVWKEMGYNNDRHQPFSLIRSKGPAGIGKLITMKYESNMTNNKDGLITLTPIRLTNSLEVFELLPQVFWGIALIVAAFLGECVCRTVIFICKKLKTRPEEEPTEPKDEPEDTDSEEYV
jgi:hypothetical protein